MSAEKLPNIREKELSQRYFANAKPATVIKASLSGLSNGTSVFCALFWRPLCITLESAETSGIRIVCTAFKIVKRRKCILLVDGEYMVTEGLEAFDSFDKWDMEVVAATGHADEALEYVQKILIPMPNKQGLI